MEKTLLYKRVNNYFFLKKYVMKNMYVEKN